VRRSRRSWLRAAHLAFLLTIFGASSMTVVAQAVSPQKKSSSGPVTQASQDIVAVRDQLFEVLWMSPKLTRAIKADATLLADEAYVSRNNPELAGFLRSHPEVVRNPEFYLFFSPDFPREGGIKVAAVWSELHSYDNPPNDFVIQERILAFLVFVLILAALLWIFRIALESRKWNRLSKMQNDFYSKLLDKCGTNEELLASLRTSAGKPFFDLAAIEPLSASPLSRVFLPLQLGIVLTLAGGGFLSMRPSLPEHDARIFLGIGTLVLMVGLGLMISAAASYFLARHLRLLPKPGMANGTSAGTSAS